MNFGHEMEFEHQYLMFVSCIQKSVIQGDTKKWERLKNPTKIEEIQEKKIDRN